MKIVVIIKCLFMSNHYNEWKTKKEVDKLEERVMLLKDKHRKQLRKPTETSFIAFICYPWSFMLLK